MTPTHDKLDELVRLQEKVRNAKPGFVPYNNSLWELGEAALNFDFASVVRELERLQSESNTMAMFAGYCRSCALSGESEPQTFKQFEQQLSQRSG